MYNSSKINYLKHILTRKEGELIKKVYKAQKGNPKKGDFAILVEKDLKTLGISHEDVAS